MDGGAGHGFERGVLRREDDGCAFILDDGTVCGAERRARSAYCATHHARCYIPGSSRRGLRRLREVEALASAVGGRRGRPGRTPPERFLRRLENAVRRFARAKCSCIVQGEKP